MALTVYEVRNHTLFELYIGISEESFEALQKRHRLLRPIPIKHWDYKRHRIVYAEIDHKLPDEDARVFFESYARMIEVPDWVSLRDTGSGDSPKNPRAAA